MRLAIYPHHTYRAGDKAINVKCGQRGRPPQQRMGVRDIRGCITLPLHRPQNLKFNSQNIGTLMSNGFAGRALSHFQSSLVLSNRLPNSRKVKVEMKQ